MNREATFLYNYGTPHPKRWYRFKAWLCISLGLEQKGYAVHSNQQIVAIGQMVTRSAFLPPHYDFTTWASLRVLTVGKGVFSNWRFSVYWHDLSVTTPQEAIHCN